MSSPTAARRKHQLPRAAVQCRYRRLGRESSVLLLQSVCEKWLQSTFTYAMSILCICEFSVYSKYNSGLGFDNSGWPTYLHPDLRMKIICLKSIPVVAARYHIALLIADPLSCCSMFSVHCSAPACLLPLVFQNSIYKHCASDHVL